jgi:hypothetical protein
MSTVQTSAEDAIYWLVTNYSGLASPTTKAVIEPFKADRPAVPYISIQTINSVRPLTLIPSKRYKTTLELTSFSELVFRLNGFGVDAGEALERIYFALSAPAAITHLESLGWTITDDGAPQVVNNALLELNYEKRWYMGLRAACKIVRDGIAFTEATTFSADVEGTTSGEVVVD